MDARPQDPCSSDKEEVRIGVVLSAGGLRGAAHAGVLRQLVRHGVPLHAIVGVSAGAIVAAYYAAVGLELEEMIQDAETFRGRHLLAHSVAVRGGARLAPSLRRWCGVIPDRLRQLEAATFDRLHHGVHRLGIVCHDLSRGRARYFGTGCDQQVKLSDAVRASASIPHLFPAIPVSSGTEPLRLTDGGVTDPVPVTFARVLMGATHIVVSDCCSIGARRSIRALRGFDLASDARERCGRLARACSQPYATAKQRLLTTFSTSSNDGWTWARLHPRSQKRFDCLSPGPV
jgi:NTE family protein